MMLTCPGLFYATPARDGSLSRIRIPGGIVTEAQCVALADLTERFSDGTLQITNRANLQIRAVQAIENDVLTRLQVLGLASVTSSVDHLRNIMTSPTAGIDLMALIDTCPLVRQWDEYLANHPELAALSAKFSVCFDGGERVSVRDRPNDISLVAVKTDTNVYFRLHLSVSERGEPPSDVGVIIKPEESLAVLAAMAAVYCDYTLQHSHTGSRKPRLRELLHDWGVETYLQAVAQRSPLTRDSPLHLHEASDSYKHLGVHTQQQPGLSYLGVVVPLGRLDTQQLRGLSALATKYGNGTLRLTPWQNVLIPNVPNSQIAEVQQALAAQRLHVVTHPYSALVACAGTRGCKSSATDTQGHAQILAAHLEQCITLDRPINIHLSGCEKSCAQHHKSDITLLGVIHDCKEAYEIYVGDGLIGRECAIESLNERIEFIIQIYQTRRNHLGETFKEFINRHTRDELKQLFTNEILKLHA